MSKTLAKIQELYMPKAEGERQFFQRHVIQKSGYRGQVSPVTNATGTKIAGHQGDGNAMFKGDVVQTYDREANRMGYNPNNDDEEAYEYFAQPEPNDDEREEFITLHLGQPVYTDPTDDMDEAYSYDDDRWHPKTLKHDGKTYFSTGKRGVHAESGKGAAEYAHNESKHKVWLDINGSVHGESKTDGIIGKVKATWNDTPKTPTGKKKVAEEVIVERVLSQGELDKREDLIKSMKGSTADFKKRYGDNWKSVMYATATKMAKKD